MNRDRGRHSILIFLFEKIFNSPMRSTYLRSIQLGFGLSLLILIATSVASYVSIRNLIYSSQQVNQTNNVLQKLENVISFVKDAETGQRGYLLTGDSNFLEPYHGAYGRTTRTLDTVQQLTLDNPDQQASIEALRRVIGDRFAIMEYSIVHKLVDISELLSGKTAMDSARLLVTNMQESARRLLADRTESLNRFSSFTPILIIVAALIALFCTFYFYRKVSESFRDKIVLTDQLQQKDQETSDRIDIIQGIAGKISQGDYKIRMNDADKDGLGSLAGSLNRMASALDHSFTLLSNKEWLQAGIALLSEKMMGEKDVFTLTSTIMDHLATYTNSQVGAFYLMTDHSTLELKSGYAFKLVGTPERIRLGEGIIGQVAQSRKEIILDNIQADDFLISFGAGDIRPRNIIAFPILFENTTKGVIELGSLESYTVRELELCRSISENIGIALNTSQSRTRLQELLEETQAQSEELQAQHSELENLNAELEAQTEKLQASEEELKVQQEELTESNQALQERSRLLEDKNQLVLHRNDEIQKKSEELVLSARYKSEFLANMSHELRTPLNSILLLSRLLGENHDQNLKTDQVEYARVIQSSGHSLLLLIDDILDLSKIESGKMDLEYERVPLSDITQDMQIIFEPLAREKGIDFAVQTQESLPSTIETDKQRLEQIIKNLLSNAIKFTSTGRVELSLSPSPILEGFINISVTDSGIGIADEKQKMIFEAFQQADGSTRRKYGGTGLGLSISRQLALLLQGNISLSSELGRGSVFTLSIPIRKETAISTHDAKATSLTDAPPAPQVTVPDPTPAYISTHIPEAVPDDRNLITTADKVILIVEDDTAFATALLDFTRKKGYKGVVSVRGDEGIELARKFLPAGILLDIQLPVKSGWEVMDEIKKDKQTRHIPVHIMSSFEAKKQSMMSGAIDFINKPMVGEQMNSIFEKIEFYLKKESKKVLIIEDNSKHAEALSYFLDTHKIYSVISSNIDAGLDALQNKEVDCVILDMGIPDERAYQTMETLKVNKGLENIPVIIFTGKSLSRTEEMKIKRYADSIVVKTAHSYKRILDEVSLFLHIVEENKKSAGGPAAKSQPLGEVLKNKTVLLADDDVRNIFSLTRVLEQHQMHVIPAMNGKEALQAVQQKRDIDIVLMDMMMPELDGYDAITAIRKLPAGRNLPVIAVTAKAMTGDREKCIAAGASDYISKPVDLDQLISLLRIWLYDTMAKTER